MKRIKYVWCIALMAAVLVSGCGAGGGSEASGGQEFSDGSEASAGPELSGDSKTDSSEASLDEAAKHQAGEDPASSEEEGRDSAVASRSEMTDVKDVVEEGMTPVKADSLKEGTYSVTVDSSSSMFQITECRLKVKDGQMTADMTMGGTGYLYIYPGTGEEAAQADAGQYIPYEEVEGLHHFSLPVPALDQGIPCSAFSRRKEKWYDRTLVVRADSLPPKAWKEDQLVRVSDLGLSDGTYQVEVDLQGGSGRASIQSPARLKVKGKKAIATLVWSSPNYDYMIFQGKKYLPVNKKGNSTFRIPVPVFDRSFSVTADTTAMSTPHEIRYSLRFDSSTVKSQ